LSNKHNLNRGIASLGTWKQKLKVAIDTKQSDCTPAIVQQDNQCRFGKWLHSCNNEEKSSPHYHTVKSLHAQFHKEAASILKLALSGNNERAKEAMSLGSDYKKIASSLSKEMMEWKQNC